MRVRSCQHVRIGVPHQICNGDGVQALLNRIGRKGVPEVREAVSLLQLFLDRVEATAHSHWFPRLAVRIAEQDAIWIATHPLPGDRKCRVVQVNDSWQFPALRLVRREHPTAVSEVDVPGVDSQQFLRSGASLPCQLKQVAESWVTRRCENRLELGLGNNLLAAACRGLLEMLDRRAVDIALPDRPVECGLNSGTRVALATGGP